MVLGQVSLLLDIKRTVNRVDVVVSCTGSWSQVAARRIGTENLSQEELGTVHV